MEKINYKFSQLQQASRRLDEALALDFPTPDTKADSVIQRFEFTAELFWKFLKAVLDFKGVEVNAAPIDVVRAAKAVGFIAADETWIDLIRDRNLTSHTYDEAQAQEIYQRIRDRYAGMFREFIEQYGQNR